MSKQGMSNFDTEFFSAINSAAQKAIEKGKDPDQVSESIEKAIYPAIKQTTLLIADDLIKAGPAMLRERWELRDGFEERLAKKWGTALDLYMMSAVAAEEAGSYINERLRPDPPTYLHHALTSIFARACRISLEIHYLLTGGYAGAATARCRSIHELAVLANVLSNPDVSNPEELAQGFLEHRYIRELEDAQAYANNSEALNIPPIDKNEIEQLRLKCDELKKKYGGVFAESYGWAAPLFDNEKGKKPHFAMIEKYSGLNHLRPYYKNASHEIHGDSLGLNRDVVSVTDTEQVRLTGPSEFNISVPAQLGLISLFQCLASFHVACASESPQSLLYTETVKILVDRAIVQIHECEIEAHSSPNTAD